MRKLVIIAFAALTAACGFQPMYGSTPEASGVLFQSIQINQTGGDSRTGYWLQDALRNRLTANNAPDKAAEMTIRTSETTANLGVQLTDAATRADLYLTVAYALNQRDAKGDPLPPITGTFTSVATYNIAQSPYAEITALADARKRAAEDVAERIARDIAFRTKPAK